MPKKLLILGSSGSIGKQTLEIVREFPSEFDVVGLSVNTNIALLKDQIKEFAPKAVVVSDEAEAAKMQDDTIVFTGSDAFEKLIDETNPDIVLNALVGFAGLKPTLYAIERGKQLLLANKESLVVAGEIIMDEVQKNIVPIIPVDSEHSAIFQCMQGEYNRIEKIILTCSGGPFFGKKREELQNITPEDALKHPNWDMGAKITIDSATLMNKALEIIEAMHLFDVSFDQIEVSIHRQSIIHSMVEFEDGNILAQANPPDMRFPISYALFYPDRKKIPSLPRIDFTKQNWTFEQPDRETFIALDLAKYAVEKGGTYPTVLNTANEIAVEKFLKKEISFLEISEFVKEALEKHEDSGELTLDRVFELDRKLRSQFIHT